MKKARLVYVPYNPNAKQVELFNHQIEALERYKDEEIIPLFFEMGCGKTATLLKIAEYKFKQEKIEGMLVIAPNDVHMQWYNDLVACKADPDAIRWLDVPFEAQCVGGRGGQEHLLTFDRVDTFKFVAVNVDTFSTKSKWQEIVDWANLNDILIAIDEATVIKNPDSLRAKRLLYEFNYVLRRGKSVVASQKRFPYRAVLTGTPVTNGPMDLWAIMEFIKPNYFNRNYYSFKNYFCMFTKLAVETTLGSSREISVMLTEKTWSAIKSCSDYYEASCLFGCSEDTYMTIMHQNKFIGPFKHADELKALVEKHAMFKRLVECVDMPETEYVIRQVGMSPEQEGVYKSMKKDLLAEYNTDGKDYMTTAKNKLVVSIRLQQISSGFIIGKRVADEYYDIADLIDSDIDINKDLMPDEVIWLGESIPKLDALMRDIAECEKPIIILTRYTAEADKIYNMCKDKYSTCLITGWKIVGSIEDFKAGKYEIMVANSAKIHRGFNLQIAHTTLFYSNSFSMEIRQQAEFRTFRIGQHHPCLYIDYSCSEIDNTINRALSMKKNLLEYIRNKDMQELI